MSLTALETPCLLLDEARLRRNCEAMRAHLARLGVAFRPHLKTAKCIEVARIAMPEAAGPATVSTLGEADYFAARGVKDLIYAVGIAPAKLDRLGAIRRTGCDLALLLDSVAQADAVAAWSAAHGMRLPALLELDGDGHRAGVAPDDAAGLTAIGRALEGGGAELRGVLVHYGGSYGHDDPVALATAAEAERLAAVTAAGHLRAAGFACPVVSVGSTPTARFARHLEGVTEVRAGVYMFGDLVQAGIGACAIDDIALSVLASVIGHQRERGWILIDAGWMALSRDRGTAGQTVDQGYGLVCDAAGRPYGDLIVADTNQEHGIVALRPGAAAPLPDLAVGTLLRVLPNHACATGAQHDAYHVLDESGARRAEWARLRGW